MIIINIIGKSECTASQMAQYLISKNPNAKPWALEYAQLYLEEGEFEGIRGDGAWIQSCKETGNFTFTGGTAVTFNQNNFCGLGVTKKGLKGHSFDTPRLGIRAQIQHLKGYATTAPLKNSCIDPRYKYITKGCAPRFEDLTGKWAVPGYNTNLASSLEDAMNKGIGYGFDIITGINNMKAIKDNNKEVTTTAYKVAIDSGHFSNSAGKRSPEGYREHWITTNIAYYLDVALKRCGVDTLKVAWDDKNGKDDFTDVSLTTRQKLIKDAKCDISISCHANAHGNGSTYTTAQGIETFIHSNSTKVKDSKSLANKVQAYLIKGTRQTNRGVKSSDFAMCNCTAMGTKASILIEYGFMTNKYEEELMKSESFCKECAEETAHGICDYLGVPYKSSGSSASVSTPSTTQTTTTTARSYLMEGDKGDAVGKLQENLNYLGYSCGTVDKNFGSKTDKALRNFQKAYKLTVNGKYDSTSQRVLEDAVAKKKNASISKPSTTSTSNYIHNGLDYSLVFNPTYYANKYSDLKKAFGTDSKKLFNHFVTCGMKEARQGSVSFNVNTYKSKYIDLQKSFGNNLPKYYEHYIKYGYKEKRQAT